MIDGKSGFKSKTIASPPIVFKLFRDSKGNSWFTIEVKAESLQEVRSLVGSLEKWAIALVSMNMAPAKDSGDDRHV